MPIYSYTVKRYTRIPQVSLVRNIKYAEKIFFERHRKKKKKFIPRPQCPDRFAIPHHLLIIPRSSRNIRPKKYPFSWASNLGSGHSSFLSPSLSLEIALSLSSQLAALTLRETRFAQKAKAQTQALNFLSLSFVGDSPSRQFTGGKRFDRVERVSDFRLIDFTVRSRSAEDFEAWSSPRMARGADSSRCSATLPSARPRFFGWSASLH